MCPENGAIVNTESEGLSSTKFERILEAATDGIVTLDRERRYRYTNAAAESIMGGELSKCVD